MHKLSATLITGAVFFLGSGNILAANPVDAAIQQLDTDVAKLKADQASHADRDTLLVDKEKVKADKSALAAARRHAKMHRGLSADQ